MTRPAALTRTVGLSLLGLLNACGGSSVGAGSGGGNTIIVSYHLGGTISGLTTGGLALANGSDTVSPPAGATAFTFGISVNGGANYAVTVQTQPTNATCAVGNGAGTVSTAAVTSVQVSCSLNTYPIGGTISGLTATGLTLANGSDTVNPTANATSFVFATPVTAGNTYNVTVTQQPSGQNCTLANAGGTATASVSNVAITCAPVPVAGWGKPVVVGTGVYPPLLANDPSGVAFFLAWCTCTGVVTNESDATAPALASRYTDAGGWTTPLTMAHGRLTGLQFDAQGKGFALWAVPTGVLDSNGLPDGTVDPMFSRYTPGSGWGIAPTPFAISGPPILAPPNSRIYAGLSPLGLSVALDGSANVLVHQQTYITSSLTGAIIQEDDAALGGGALPGSDILQIGAASPVFPATTSSPSFLTLANGSFDPFLPVVTYWPFDPVTPSTIPGQFATLFNTNYTASQPQAGGSPGLDTQTHFSLALNSGTAIDLTVIDNLPAAAATAFPVRVSKASTSFAANGDALVTWSVLAADLSSVTVFAEQFISGAWQGRKVVYTSSQDVNYYLFNALPVAAVDSAGDGMIVFNSLGTLMAVKLSAASGFGTAASIATIGGGKAVSLQMDSRGNAFLVADDAGSGANVRRYDAASATWGAPGITVASDPVLALDNTGNAMVAWTAGGSILASRYH